jgi:hypothetical protein
MEEWPERSPNDVPLDERVVEFLAERPGRVAFNGLRRALDAHPESLVRSLRRLERHGVVRRTVDGYGLVDHPGPSSPTPAAHGPPFAEVALAPGHSREEVFGRLAGRWFGPLRWVGLYEPADGPWLVWSVEGARGGLVRLGIRQGRLILQVDDTSNDEVRERLEDAARSLLRHAIDALAPMDSGPTAAVARMSPTRPLTFAS